MNNFPGTSFSIANVVIPKSGPKTIPCILNFTGVDAHTVDLSQFVDQGRIEYVQTVFIDNSENPNPITLITELTNQRIICPAGAQGYFSVLQPNNPVFDFETTAGAFNVPLQFMNVPVQPCVWGNSNGSFVGLTDAELRAAPVDVTIAGGGSGLTDAELRASPVDVDTGLVQSLTDTQLRASPVDVDTGLVQSLTDTQLRATPVKTANTGSAFTNRSIANLSGASEQLMAANANRRTLIIQNVAANPMAVNLTGGAAALNTAGSINIAAGGSLVLEGTVPVGAINIIGTANDDVTAYEA